MSKTITVRATWEFEFDAEGYDSKFVDIPGLAKDSAKCAKEYIEKMEAAIDVFNKRTRF